MKHPVTACKQAKHSKNFGLSKVLEEAGYYAFPQTISVVEGKPRLACALFFVCVFAVYDLVNEVAAPTLVGKI